MIHVEYDRNIWPVAVVPTSKPGKFRVVNRLAGTLASNLNHGRAVEHAANLNRAYWKKRAGK